MDAASILKAARGSLSGALKLCERDLLAAALRLSAGNRSHAARLLGISARSMFSKLRQHGLT
jgi:DNA-binding NtrC family response regulator